jgi:hypothetical protein
MTRRLPLCDFCVLPTPAVTQIRDKRRRRPVAVCAHHRDKTETLTTRQRGVVSEHLRRVAAGEKRA